MKRFISLISIILLLFTFTSTTAAKKDCTLKLINNTNYTYVFKVEWIDHPFMELTFGKPWMRAMGEVKPNKSWELENYSPGLYGVEYWIARMPSTSKLYKPPVYKGFIIKPNTKKVIITLIMINNKPVILFTIGYSA